MQIDRRAALKGLVGAGVAVAAAGGGYGFLAERHAIGVTEATLRVAGLPAALSGLRIGLMTDIHHSQWVSADDVSTAAGLLTRAQPDLIVLGGDYVTWGDRAYVGPCAEVLGTLSATHGVFGILGNHDDDRDMAAALGANGVQVLKDARTRLVIRDEPVELVGIRFWTKRASDVATLTKGANGFTVLLAHDPRRLPDAAAANIPLVLSGHTHGGQVVLPIVGALAAQKFSVVAVSLKKKDTAIFVSRGVGTVYVPVRVNCPPEVAVLTLQPAAPAS